MIKCNTCGAEYDPRATYHWHVIDDKVVFEKTENLNKDKEKQNGRNNV